MSQSILSLQAELSALLAKIRAGDATAKENHRALELRSALRKMQKK